MARLALIRADASQKIGTGHVRRCLALTKVLMHNGWKCRFVASKDSLDVVPELTGQALDVYMLAAGDLQNPQAIRAAAPRGCDLLIIDHYELGETFEHASRGVAGTILVIDDQPDRAHDADILVDPTPGRTVAMRTGRVPPGAICLVGPAYAPLRAELAAKRGLAKPKSGAPRLLVSFGGTDPENVTGRFLKALGGALPKGWIVDVVLGRSARHVQHVIETTADLGPGVHLHLDPPTMVPLLFGAELAVGAGGVSALERCTAGLPSILLVIADNQRDAAKAIADTGAAVLAGNVAEAVQLTHSLMHDATRRDSMAAAAAAVCDGRGSMRIALWLDPPMTKDGAAVRVRPALPEDASIMLSWQQKPETRQFARSPHVPDEAVHRAWLAARLADPDCLLNLILIDREPVGVLRLDRNIGRGWEVSILVDPARHRLGAGLAALAAARRLVPEAPLLAEVLPSNTASHGLFTRAGFTRTDGWYEQRPPSCQ